MLRHVGDVSRWLSGAFAIAFVRLFQAGVHVDVINPDFIVLADVPAAMGCRFGRWWALFVRINMRRGTKIGGIPSHLRRWGVVFPTASMAIAINLLDALPDLSGILELTATRVGAGVWLFIAIGKWPR